VAVKLLLVVFRIASESAVQCFRLLQVKAVFTGSPVFGIRLLPIAKGC
jgi:hypothetical protein